MAMIKAIRHVNLQAGAEIMEAIRAYLKGREMFIAAGSGGGLSAKL